MCKGIILIHTYKGQHGGMVMVPAEVRKKAECKRGRRVQCDYMYI